MHRLLWTLLFAFVAGCAADATPPTESHADHARVYALEPAAQAAFAPELPFRQVGLLIDTPAADIEARVDGGPWLPVEVTWSEGVHKVARLVLATPANRLELRAVEPWTFGTVEFYEDVVAGAELARDLPVTAPDAAVNGLAPASLVISRANWGACRGGAG